MKEYTISERHFEKAGHGYVSVRVSLQDDHGQAVEAVEVNLHNAGWYQMCTCQGDERQANCVHVALVKTWKRQGKPTGTKDRAMMGFRVYTLDDEGRIGYYKNGEHCSLSLWQRVMQVAA